MASPQSSSPPGPGPLLLIGQSLEIWRVPIRSAALGRPPATWTGRDRREVRLFERARRARLLREDREALDYREFLRAERGRETPEARAAHEAWVARETRAAEMAEEARDVEVRKARKALEDGALAQLAHGAAALDLNAGAGGEFWRELSRLAGHLAAALPDVPLLLDCGDARAIGGALRAAVQAAPDRPAPLVANSLRTGDRHSAALLRDVAWAGAGLVISSAAPDRDDSPLSIRQLLALNEVAARRAREAGVRGPIFADALAHPAFLDAARCRRSLALLRALRDSPDGLIPLVAVGNVGHRAHGALRPVLRRLYAAAALGAGAEALILPVEDRPLVGTVAALTGITLSRTRAVTPQPTASPHELPWLRRVSRAAAAGEPLPAPPVRAGDRALSAWEVLSA